MATSKADEAQPPASNSPQAADVEIAADAKALEFLQISRGANAPTSMVAKIWKLVKRSIAAILLLPLRIVLVLLSLTTILLLLRVVICLGGSKRSTMGNHTRPQKAVLWMTSGFYRVILLCVGVLWIRIRKPKGVKVMESNITIVANHVTMLDGGLIGYLFGCQLTGVAMNWVTKAPIASTIARAHQVLPVQGATSTKVAPDGQKQTGKSATDTIVEYQQLCAANPKLLRCLIFPEGTTKNSECLMKFRTGAFVAGQPVQPVAVRWPADIGWRHSLGGHLLNLLTRWFACIEVTILDPYVPSTEECRDPKLYADNVQRVIAEVLNLPPNSCSTVFGPKELENLFRCS